MPGRKAAVVWPIVNLGSLAIAVLAYHAGIKAGITNPFVLYGASGFLLVFFGVTCSLYFKNRVRAEDGEPYCTCCDTESSP